MPVSVKFFAGLRESLSLSDLSLPADELHTVADVWHKATDGREPPENLLCAVNHQHSALDSTVSDGDEVGFFPPVTGG
ncbi:MoaD/ThiS family protein [Granulosicoccaceae sp. 1_MG-2023]|nr:MoaD/ThiS family protein [Granulosicoccaceae sp. 1_MG-2023]